MAVALTVLLPARRRRKRKGKKPKPFVLAFKAENQGNESSFENVNLAERTGGTSTSPGRANRTSASRRRETARSWMVSGSRMVPRTRKIWRRTRWRIEAQSFKTDGDNNRRRTAGKNQSIGDAKPNNNTQEIARALKQDSPHLFVLPWSVQIGGFCMYGRRQLYTRLFRKYNNGYKEKTFGSFEN